MARAPTVLVDCFVRGRPYVPTGSSGLRDSTAQWSAHVIDQTLGIPHVKGTCRMELEFVLPARTDSWELPWEMTLNHLTKSLLEALEETFLGHGPTAAGNLVTIRARKRVARRKEETGVRIVVARAKRPR